jgi:fructose-1,6-bisphosphatase I
MSERQTISSFLADWAGQDATNLAVAETINKLCGAAVTIADLIAQGPLAGEMAAIVGDNADGDAQKFLDVKSNELIFGALGDSPVAVMGSEEDDDAVLLNEGAPLAVAVDPLDGSSNIETNVSIGTIFSIFPMSGAKNSDAASAFYQPGSNQIGAGFMVYGPQTTIVFTVGQGSHVATLDRATGEFVITQTNMKMISGKREYAINASNYRHWSPAIRGYIDDCLAGKDGPREADYNMRWVASLVAETYRILVRGGTFLYPGDDRDGYSCGRLRLVYEAFPVAMVLEQAGGMATDGTERILDLVAEDLHQRTPLVFGASDEVERVKRYKESPPEKGASSPLFGHRGLFR